MINSKKNQVAEEGLFVKKKSVNDLLTIAGKKIDRLKTKEEVDEKLRAVNESGKYVNSALRVMSNAAKKKASGKMSDSEFRSTVASSSKSIAGPIKTLYTKLGNVVEDKSSVTSDEIKAFQKYLSGLKTLLNAKKKSMKITSVKEGYEMNFEDNDLDSVIEELDEALTEAEESCSGKRRKCTESDDSCDPDFDDDCEDYGEDEDDEEDDDDEDDDDAEEGCGESLGFSSDKLEEYSDACESLINSDFDVEESDNDLLNSDGTLNL